MRCKFSDNCKCRIAHTLINQSTCCVRATVATAKILYPRGGFANFFFLKILTPGAGHELITAQRLLF